MKKKCIRQKELETADRERKLTLRKKNKETEIMANSHLTIEMPRKQQQQQLNAI